MWVREKFAFTSKEKIRLENQLRTNVPGSGCVVLSTCNRSEIYIFSPDSKTISTQQLFQQLEDYLFNLKKMDRQLMLSYVQRFEGEKVLRHLFKVTSGLESMVLGEDEILRQVKKAYLDALERNMVNTGLNISFQKAIQFAKMAKTSTNISKIPVSVASVGADWILKNNPDNKKVLIVGISGNVGSAMAERLLENRDTIVMATIRNHVFFQKDESFKCIDYIEYEERYRVLSDVGFVVSATTSPHYTFTQHMVKHHLEPGGYHEIQFLDLSVPGDIDRKIEELKGCQLMDMDDILALSKANNMEKEEEAKKVCDALDPAIEDTRKAILLSRYMKPLQSKFHGDWERIQKIIGFHRKNLEYSSFKELLEKIF